jgi:hypothetical protein
MLIKGNVMMFVFVILQKQFPGVILMKLRKILLVFVLLAQLYMEIIVLQVVPIITQQEQTHSLIVICVYVLLIMTILVQEIPLLVTKYVLIK